MASASRSDFPKSDFVPLAPGTKCRAKYSFQPEQIGQLKFLKGDILTLTRPNCRLFWYDAQDSKGQVGIVPVTYLDIPKTAVRMTTIGSGFMKPHDGGGETAFPGALRPGSFVEARTSSIGSARDAFAFSKGDTLRIVRQEAEPNWYMVENEFGQEGRVHRSIIQLTYSYAYLSIEAAQLSVQTEPVELWGPPVYASFREFKRHSGWFREIGGMAKPCEAFLPRCLAESCSMDLDDFLLASTAVYVFCHRSGRKYVESATSLCNNLSNLFTEANLYSRSMDRMSGLERELLLSSPNRMDWKIEVHLCSPVKLDVTHCLLIVQEKSLKAAKDGPVGRAGFIKSKGGLNEMLCFTNSDQFKELAASHSQFLRRISCKKL